MDLRLSRVPHFHVSHRDCCGGDGSGGGRNHTEYHDYVHWIDAPDEPNY